MILYNIQYSLLSKINNVCDTIIINIILLIIILCKYYEIYFINTDKYNYIKKELNLCLANIIKYNNPC